MTILEAMKRGKFFRRESWEPSEDFITQRDIHIWLMDGDFTLNDLLATDWELKEDA